MARAKTADEDIVFQECHWRYPWQKKLQEPMEDTHLVLHVRAGPEHRGWPVRRSRGLCAALNRKTLVWVGPEDYETDFHEKFSRRLQITGEAFFFAKDSEWLADSMHRARSRGLYPNLIFCSRIGSPRVLEIRTGVPRRISLCRPAWES